MRSHIGRAFTLVEILVVISIISVLLGMICYCSSLLRCYAEETRASNLVNQLGYAMKLYYLSNDSFPSAYPAQLGERLAPYLQEALKGYVDNPQAFVTFGREEENAEPVNKAYVTPPPRSDQNRYIVGMSPRLARARSAILFADQVVQLANRLPIKYAGAEIEPGDTVTSGTVDLATGSRIELGNTTALRIISSFQLGDGSSFHIVKMPRYQRGSLRVDAVSDDIVQVVTGAGVVCARRGVVDIDVVPVQSGDFNHSFDDADDPTGTPDHTYTTPANPQSSALGGYAIFSATSITFQGGPKVDHLIGSNGNIAVGQANQGDSAAGISGGGTLAINGNLQINGPVTYAGDISIAKGVCINGDVNGGAKVYCEGTVASPYNINASGAVTLYKGLVKGSVAASGLAMDGRASVDGNVSVTGNLSVSSGCQILGNATYGGTASIRGRIFGSVQHTAGSPPSPLSYTPLSFPLATPIVAGSSDVTVSAQQALSPGSYGALTLGGGSTITLTKGDYYFQSISCGGNATFKFATDAGKLVNIYVANGIDIGGNLSCAFDGSGTASDVYWESQGNLSVKGTVDLYGTVFLPNGSVDFRGNATLHGACYSSGPVSFGGNSSVSFCSSNRGVGAGGAGNSGGSDPQNNGGNNNNNNASNATNVPLITYIRISNHSAEVTVDAEVIDRGDDVPYIEPRVGTGATPPARELGRGTLVKATKWVAAIEHHNSIQ